ncbi:Do family serine endopeptidase [Thorsellia anophelis]|uniref:Serine protease DegQ n=1 Tax=Thorsellia anophelis DSM 18579 TaxID=1123402 RepID=A0A1H9YC93_9GAMM|nr:Do family serine endopeptidase [Thorsellia anophelis]SES66551.1 serine protease DegQ [Thorsellia anophelis DSM 18579]
MRTKLNLNKNKLFMMLALSLGLSCMSMQPAIATLPASITESQSLAPMLEKVLPAVVSVKVSGERQQGRQRQQQLPDEFRFFFGPNFPGETPRSRGSDKFEGLGSGVIIDAKEGYIITNNHVVQGADKIRIQLNDDKEYDATLIGSDEQSDIALLKVEDPKNLTEIKIANSDELRVGDFAIAIGNPFGLGQTVTSGIISALGRTGLNLEGLENFIQTDASINQGNSGGALVNLNGELIGINTAILAPGGGNIGIGFAIPSNMAKNLSQQLIEHGEVKRSLLGIKGSEMTPDIAEAFGVDAQRGAFVSEVLADSAAEKAGIQSGDILVSLEGKPLKSFAELRARIGTTTPGEEVTIGLIRDGEEKDVKVTLVADTSNTASAEAISKFLTGATLADHVNENGIKGVIIESVEKNSLAERYNLKKDDLILSANRVPVKSVSELKKALQDKPDVVALNILRGNSNIYLVFR